MQCYTELTPPTAVTHSLSIPFISAKANNLVVAKTSLLQIFELKSILTEVDVKEEQASAGQDGAQDPEKTFLGGGIQRTEATSKLSLVAEYNLSGTVTALARVKTLNTKSGGEALLISFRDAKLSLLEWDPLFYNINTVSVHYYEGEDVQESPLVPDLGDSQAFLTVDPGSRCAALRFGPRHLAILPFRQLDDDLAEDDFDPDLDDPADRQINKDVKMTDGDSAHQTPYSASFVLSLTTIDSTLTHPVHLAFLYEYREPTFGIISSQRYASSGLIQERKDVLTYTVFTLDLEQRASTTLLSVTGIPYDVHRIIPLPLPVGGALLMGYNELIHIDQAGKATAVALNEFARQSSSFPMADKSTLALRLEGCVIEQLGGESGDMLIIFSTGELAILSFDTDGRSVSALTIAMVPSERGGSLILANPSCLSRLSRGRFFLGCEDSESLLLGWTRKGSETLSRKRSYVDMAMDGIDESDEDIDDDLEDDLYGSELTTSKQSNSSKGDGTSGQITFRVHDTMPNLAPLRDIALGEPFKQVKSSNGQADKDLEVVASTGRGKAGGIAIIKREIAPTVIHSHPLKSAAMVWSVHAVQAGLQGEQKLSANAEYDQYLFATEGEESAVYKLVGKRIEQVEQGDFEGDAGATIEVGVLAEGTRIVQVLKGEVRGYDADLNFAQALPLEDETTGEELVVVGASFCDPFVLLLCDDSSIRLFEANKSGEVEEIERSTALLDHKWLSGCMYKNSAMGERPLIYLLSAEGGLHIFDPQYLDKAAYVAEGLSFLPGVLTTEYAARRSAAKDILTEILVADLGDSTHKSPFLLVRNASNDLAIYQPFHQQQPGVSNTFTQGLRWLKLNQNKLAKYSEEPALEEAQSALGSQKQLFALPNVRGYAAVAQVGTSPSLVLKETKSSPKVISIRERALKTVTTWHDEDVERGLVLLDAGGQLKVSELPAGFRYGDTGWAVKQVKLGKEVDSICYDAEKGVYVIGVTEIVPFKLPEDDYHHEWAKEDTQFLPTHPSSSLHILHPSTWSLVFTIPYEPYEQIMCVRTLHLETSEITSAIKPHVVVGTATTSGEDLATKGNVHIYKTLDVVPEPGKPETSVALRLVSKEEVKGAVTGVSNIGREGFLMMAQGQKILVRGLKEDGSLLPVAFMDVQCFVTVCKELPGTGLCLIGDAVKGLWFVGYQEEPYKMAIFGKSKTKMEVLTAEFLPWGKQLYIIVLDADMTMHVLQFDPEHPKSLSGQRLLQNSTFHTGHFPSTSVLLPSTLNATAIDPGADTAAEAPPPTNGTTSAQQSLHHVLIATQSGSLALMTPLTEPTYRRLSALQTHLQNVLEQPAGLNARAYRNVESEVGFGGRGVLDGALLLRWMEMGSQRKREAVGKVGLKAGEMWVLRSDLEIVGGAGLGYL